MMKSRSGRYSRGMLTTTAPAFAPVFNPDSRSKENQTARAERWPVSVMGVPFDPVTTEEALARIDTMIASGEPHYVVTPNVDFLVQARSDAALHRILCEADLVLCDGQPLVWASRALGNALPERVAGADLAPRLMAQAARRGHRVYLLGATPEANEAAAARLTEQYPTLQIAGYYAPPFRPLSAQENEELVCRIRATEPDILLVAFGCPKQEKWIVQNYRALGVPVCLGLGATIDFLAGRVSRAPQWMRRSGLEWSYRLLMEPRRLASRYAKDFRCFGTAFLAEWWALGRTAGAARAAGTVDLRVAASWLQVRVTGTLDRATLERAAHVWRKIGAGEYGCRIDLAAVEFIDSTAIAALAHWHRQLRRRGQRLVLLRPSAAVQALLRRAGVGHFETSDLSTGAAA